MRIVIGVTLIIILSLMTDYTGSPAFGGDLIGMVMP